MLPQSGYIPIMRRKASKIVDLHFRCSPSEFHNWERTAEELGTTLSEWVRTWLNYASQRDVHGKLIIKS